MSIQALSDTDINDAGNAYLNGMRICDETETKLSREVSRRLTALGVDASQFEASVNVTPQHSMIVVGIRGQYINIQAGHANAAEAMNEALRRFQFDMSLMPEIIDAP